MWGPRPRFGTTPLQKFPDTPGLYAVWENEQGPFRCPAPVSNPQLPHVHTHVHTHMHTLMHIQHVVLSAPVLLQNAKGGPRG